LHKDFTRKKKTAHKAREEKFALSGIFLNISLLKRLPSKYIPKDFLNEKCDGGEKFDIFSPGRLSTLGQGARTLDA